jgi:magnesium chelatase family protein
VLFLDELPEFRRSSLELLRQPMEEGRIHLVRARGAMEFPARFTLVAAMNPCPCGDLGNPTRSCGCDPSQIRRYRGRLSGPLLDRIDLQVLVSGVSGVELISPRPGEATEVVRSRVRAARERQWERFAGRGLGCNAEMGPGELRSLVPVPRAVARLLQHAQDRLGLSPRAYHRILKVARTLADLSGDSDVAEAHAAEAIHFRELDRPPR